MKLFFELLRVKQWVKNAFVILPFIFSRKWLLLLDYYQNPKSVPFSDAIAPLFYTLITVISFCSVASGIYILNDWVDCEQDKIHPKKKFRPIPSGQISTHKAFTVMVCLWIGGFLLIFSQVPSGQTTLVLLAYLILNISYSLKLKQMVILDVMCIALGFVLRVLAGATAIHVLPSFWLLLCTSTLALFLGFCKRRHECMLFSDQKIEHRQVLEHYSLQFLDQMISVVTTSTLIFYVLYTLDSETQKIHHTQLHWTIPFVIYGIFRYLFLVYHCEEGGSPTDILYSDPGIIVAGALWILCVCFLLIFT
ncbi:MAG: decaprenyl-phosphate phosphoribosyltransferase [Planctomycetota bacterium]